MGEVPKGRQGQSALIKGDKMYIFGGKTSLIFEVNEFWKFDLNTHRFSLIHDSLLEREEQTDQKDEKNKRKLSSTTSKFFSRPKRTQIIAEDKESRGKISGKSSKSEAWSEIEKIVMEDKQVKLMCNSVIFSVTKEDEEYINKEVSVNKEITQENIRTGEVPLPRDGHSAEIYNNKMYVFGGDRNKFPFNKIFVFDFEGYERYLNDKM